MTDKPDYTQKARASFDGFDTIAEFLSEHARTLEALDTEHAAHEATKALMECHVAHIAELTVERNTAGAELQALRGKVASVLAQVLPGLQFNGNVPVTVELLRSLLPAPEPDPLVVVMKEYGHSHPDEAAERMAGILARHGLTIAAIGGKHD